MAALFAIAFVGVALALFVVPSSNFERLARSSGPSPALPTATVTNNALGLPTGASLYVPYPLDVSPVESFDTKQDLVDLKVNVGTIPPTVGAVLHSPDGTTKSLTLPGVLTVSGDPTSDFTASVTNNGATVLSARLVTAPSPGFVEVKSSVANLDFRESGDLCTFYDPVTSKLTSLSVCDPLSRLTGLPSALGVTGTNAPDVFGVAANATSILGIGVPLAGVGWQGDPFTVNGATLSDASGNALLTVAVGQPSADSPAFTVDADGPAVASLYSAVLAKDATGQLPPGPATHLTLVVGFGSMPFGLVGIGWGEKSANSGQAVYGAVELANAYTGYAGYAYDTVVALYDQQAAGAVNTVLATAWGNYTRLASPYALDLGATTAGIFIQATKADGSKLDASVPFGVDPQKVDVSSTGLGLPDTSAAVSVLTGLVTAVQGSLSSPQNVSLSALGTLPFVDFGNDGRSAWVKWAGYDKTVPGGSIKVSGDPWSLDDFSVSLVSAGSPVATATVHRAPTLGSTVIGRPEVTVSAAGQALTLAPPLALSGDLASGSVTGAKIWSPADPSVTLVDLERGASGWTLTTPAGTQSLPAAPASLIGNPVTDSPISIDVGSGALMLAVDRATGLVTIGGTAVPVSQQVNGPLALAGSLSNPSTVGLTDPSSGKNVLLYQTNADGTGSLSVLGNTTAKNTRLLTIEGDPRSAQGFSIVLRGTDGSTVQSTQTISIAAIAKDQKVPPALADPILSAIGAGAEQPKYVTDALDGRGNIALADEITAGSAYLSGQAPHSVLLAIPGGADTFTHISLRAAKNAAPDDSAHVSAFAPYGTAGDLHVYRAPLDVAALGAGDGDAVRFSVRYDHAVSPFVAETLDESNGGAGYAFFVDARAPLASMSAPTLVTPNGTGIAIVWTGSDGGAGLATFDVQWSSEARTWHDLLLKTPDGSAQFTGEVGKEYTFRVRATDAVGNLGAWSVSTKIAIPRPAGSEQGTHDRAPTVNFTAPLAGSVLVGKVSVAWNAADPDGTTPIVILYESRDAGATWHVLYSGSSASSFAWNTAHENDGTYALRATATDGQLSTNATLSPLIVKNLASADNGFLNATAPANAGGQNTGTNSGPGGAGGTGNTGGTGGTGGAGGAGGSPSSGVSTSTATTLILVAVVLVLSSGLAVLFYLKRK